jgi:hypothetical protein
MSEPLNRQTALALNRLDDRVVPTVLDLTTAGAHGELAGGLFTQYDAQPTGTGQIDSFLRIQGRSAQTATQTGFNTSARPPSTRRTKARSSPATCTRRRCRR